MALILNGAGHTGLYGAIAQSCDHGIAPVDSILSVDDDLG